MNASEFSMTEKISRTKKAWKFRLSSDKRNLHAAKISDECKKIMRPFLRQRR